MRSYYFLVPLVLWLFSPDLMLAASVVLVAVLYRVDRMPQAEGYLEHRVAEVRPPVNAPIPTREATAVGLKVAA